MREKLSHLVVVLLILLGQAITAMALDQRPDDPVRTYSFSGTNSCVGTFRVQSNGQTFRCSISPEDLAKLCPSDPLEDLLLTLTCLRNRVFEETQEGLKKNLEELGFTCEEDTTNTGGMAAQVYGSLAVECP